MSQEIESVQSQPEIVNLPSLIEESLPSTQDGSTLNPIGAILYQSGEKIMLLGENDHGNLVTSAAQTPNSFDKNRLFGWKGRLQDLSHLDEIQVSQVQLDAINVQTHRSIRTQPSVSVKIPYVNPQTTKQELFITDEEALLKVFTGENGGLAIFEGASRPEEIALVMEQQATDKRFGLIFFLHPEESDLGIDSVTGLYTFLQDINGQFNSQSNFTLQLKALDELEKQISTGRMKFTSEVREELFRTQIIAYSRLGERTKDPKYQKYLNVLLPGINEQGAISKLLGRLGINITTLPEDSIFEQSVNKMILGGVERREDSNDPVAQEEKEIWETLHSPDLADLRESLGEFFGANNNGSNDAMDLYTRKLAKKLVHAKEPEVFDDLRRLLLEIKSTKYSEASRSWKIQTHLTGDGAIVNTTGDNAPIKNHIDRILVDLINRRNSSLFDLK